MKKVIKSALVCMATFAAFTVSAQPQAQSQVQGQVQSQEQTMQQTPEERAKKSTEQLKKDLTLTEAQEKQVHDLHLKANKEMAKQMEDMRTSGQQPDRETMKTAMEKRQKDFSDSMKKVLNEDQFTKWEKQQEERRANMRNRTEGMNRQ